MRGGATLAGATFTALLVMSGCTPSQPSPSPTAPGTPVATATGDPIQYDDDHETPAPAVTPDLDQFSPAPTDALDDHSEETVSAEPVPTWNEAAQASALTAADKAMRAFARPELDYATWWAELEPLVAPSAAEDFSYIDPANIAAREVTGLPAVYTSTSAYVVTVEVPTDAGRWHLVLTRRMDAHPWLVTTITPIEEAR